jgi:hypothetical protein
MITLRKIGVQSAWRIGFLLGVATTIANVIGFFVILFVRQGIPPTVFPAEVWMEIALGVLISGIITALAMGLFAALYNMNGLFGSLKLEFDMPDSPSEKRKNGEDETAD